MTMYYSCLIFAILLSFPSAYGVKLERNYYKDTCPNVEVAIKKTVATEANRGICAGVIRLFFHDCFVNGCDGSVLLDYPGSEKDSPDNLGLRGFEVIKAAKEAAEASCGKPYPALVSCADVLAYAARDCVELLGGFRYDVDAGRLDSRVSQANDTKGNLPKANSTLEELKKNFADKGLSQPEDLAALTGAHSIGVAHCGSFKERFNDVKPNEINSTYADSLREKCRNGDNVMVVQDHVTPKKLDVQWYENEIANEVLFFSDWVLRTDPILEKRMNIYAGLIPTGIPFLDGTILWEIDFENAMKKMGDIPGGGVEIRKVCSARN